MSATYINTGGGLIQYSGIITTSEINNLGTTPYIFTTPAGFMPTAFAIKVTNGTTQPGFTSLLLIETISSSKVLFLGTDPGGIDVYNFFGLQTRPVGIPTHVAAQNIELLINNFHLLPQNLVDPTPGDYTYKFNLLGTIIF
jgi:hypothetical protein